LVQVVEFEFLDFNVANVCRGWTNPQPIDEQRDRRWLANREHLDPTVGQVFCITSTP